MMRPRRKATSIAKLNEGATPPRGNGVLDRLFGGLLLAPAFALTFGSAGALLLGMAGALVTLDLSALVRGFEVLFIGALIEAPLAGLAVIVLAGIGMLVSWPVHRVNVIDAIFEGTVPFFGVIAGFGWALVQILFAGVEMSFWAGLTGGVLGGLAGCAGAFGLTDEEATPGARRRRRRRGSHNDIDLVHSLEEDLDGDAD